MLFVKRCFLNKNVMEQKTTRIAFLKIGDAAKESDARQHAHHDSADFLAKHRFNEADEDL